MNKPKLEWRSLYDILVNNSCVSGTDEITGEITAIKNHNYVSKDVLATAIEKSNLQFLDEFNRLSLATDGGIDDVRSKAHALHTLSQYYLDSYYPALPDDLPYDENNPLYSFGWIDDALPNFNEIDPHFITHNTQVENDLAAETTNAIKKTTVTTETKKYKPRRNTLDPAIDKAIRQAGNSELADVYLKLKELALNGEAPFTGAFEGDALCYTNDNDEPAKLTKDALGKRLKKRQ